MRHAVVRRVALGVSGLLVSVALLFAWAVRLGTDTPAQPPDRLSSSAVADEGRRLFESRCRSCHDEADMRRVVRDAPDPGAARREMLAFLEHHGHCSSEERGPIVDFLRQGP